MDASVQYPIFGRWVAPQNSILRIGIAVKCVHICGCGKWLSLADAIIVFAKK